MVGDDLALLVEAAREAGELMMRMRPEVRTRRKPDGSPVTEADLAVDALLKARLLGARPDYGWLSEESADDADRLRRPRVFVVDPIDGTTAFVKGKPWFCTALAVVAQGRPVAAAIYAPATGEMFAAAAGRGATRNGAPIHASAAQTLAGAVVCGEARLLPPPRWPPLRLLGRNAIAYRLCLTAAGDVDATLSPTPKWEWDVAAGALIAAEAGAAVTDAQGEPLVFNRRIPRLPGLVACAPALLPAVLERTLISPATAPMPRAL
jgi:myo-inositol-1(or 4)-monophosphatase